MVTIKKFLLIGLVLLLASGCASQNEVDKIIEEKEELTQKVADLEKANWKLYDETVQYSRQITKLEKKIDRLELTEDQLIIDTRLNLDVLEVILKYFEGIKENDDDKIKSAVSSDYFPQVKKLLNWNEEVENLKEIGFMGERDVGRPEVITGVSWVRPDGNVNGRMFVLQKFQDGWEIVMID